MFARIIFLAGHRLPNSLDELYRLPLSFKDARGPYKFRDVTSDVAAVQITRRHNRSQLVYRCSAEPNYIRDFLLSLQDGDRSRRHNCDGFPRCISATGSFFHRRPTPAPYRGPIATSLNGPIPLITGTTRYNVYHDILRFQCFGCRNAFFGHYRPIGPPTTKEYEGRATRVIAMVQCL